jgi:type IV secretion system protein VirB2
MSRFLQSRFIRPIQLLLRIAKVASLVAIVIGGYGFAHGEPGAKKALAGVAAGTGIAVLAVNVLSWLWGV